MVPRRREQQARLPDLLPLTREREVRVGIGLSGNGVPGPKERAVTADVRGAMTGVMTGVMTGAVATARRALRLRLLRLLRRVPDARWRVRLPDHGPSEG